MNGQNSSTKLSKTAKALLKAEEEYLESSGWVKQKVRKSYRWQHPEKDPSLLFQSTAVWEQKYTDGILNR